MFIISAINFNTRLKYNQNNSHLDEPVTVPILVIAQLR
jgi:hypothetical protein